MEKTAMITEGDTTDQNATDENATEDDPMDGDTADESLTAVELQQQYFDNIDDCDWVRYELGNRTHLMQNIAFAMFGAPPNEGDFVVDSSGKECDVILQGYTSRQKEQVTKIFEVLCKQGKYSLNDTDIYLSVILVVCCKPQPLKFYQMEPKMYWCDLHNRKDIIIWCTPLFRIRKCIPPVSGGKGCRLYIDEEARVYHSWASYVDNNTLPKCVMVVPTNGEYIGTQSQDGTVSVDLSIIASPALGPLATVLSVADTTTTLASIGSMAVLGASLFTPVGPLVLAGATVATVATGVYGAARSGFHLNNRRKHEQTVSPTDAEARGSWINIAASTVGITAGAASTLLSQSAAAGTNMTRTGIFLEKSVNILQCANLVTGSTGLLNSLAHFVVKYRKHGERPTKLELFQFTASTLFFFNAVLSNKTAQKIIEEAQTKTINNYRESLRSNRHRKMFDKVASETRRLGGILEGNTEVIRGIRNIANKDQYFADVLRINKDINSNKLRISLSADGKVNINARHAFHPDELAGLSKEARGKLFTSLGVPDLTVKNVPTKLQTTIQTNVSSERKKSSYLIVRPGEVIRIGCMMVRLTSYSTDQMAVMLHDLSKDVSNALITLAVNVADKIITEDVRKLLILNPDDDVIVQTVRFVFNFLKQNIPVNAPNIDDGIKVVLVQFFQEGSVRTDTLRGLLNRLHTSIEERFDSYMREYPNKKEIICGNCKGTTYA